MCNFVLLLWGLEKKCVKFCIILLYCYEVFHILLLLGKYSVTESSSELVCAFDG